MHAELPPCHHAGLVGVHCFEMYAVMQRPMQPLLKALESLDWASFGLSVQASFCNHLDWSRMPPHMGDLMV